VIQLAPRGVRAVLLDIEGTTTPMAFVHEVLFPFARTRLAEYLSGHWREPGTDEIREKLADEHAADRARGEQPPVLVTADETDAVRSAAAYAAWLMDRDRKSPGLKQLQGLIWEDGYRAGALRGQVFADVPAAIRRWAAAGVRIGIYSSGSEQAQRRLFESTEHGDLTPVIEAFFDTAVGAKVEAPSYGRIAAALNCPSSQILFVSDVPKELTAAREAGMAVALSLRPGNPPVDVTGFETVRTFDEIA
jgi:enolase-phosphatase E1